MIFFFPKGSPRKLPPSPPPVTVLVSFSTLLTISSASLSLFHTITDRRGCFCFFLLLFFNQGKMKRPGIFDFSPVAEANYARLFPSLHKDSLPFSFFFLILSPEASFFLSFEGSCRLLVRVIKLSTPFPHMRDSLPTFILTP